MTSATSSDPRLEFVTCSSPAGLHRMAYWEWGDPRNDKILLCVHGLTRTGRDFDRLARRLSGEYRVVCPDVVGRGASDWLASPMFYVVPQYVADMVTLLARLQPATLHWVGTSMGGLIGMVLAGMTSVAPRMRPARIGAGMDLPAAAGLRVDKLVLNDIGHRITSSAIARIGQYVGEPGTFDTFDAAVEYVRGVAASFGPHTDDEWRELTQYVMRRHGDHWIKHYDLKISAPFMMTDEAAQQAGEQVLLQSWQAIDCPILVLRGAESDLLTADIVDEMPRLNPHARVVELPGVGHAPTLMHAGQIDIVQKFLAEA
jgi:pimeloyl-ACP methyl ester carboxylesterase